MATKTKCQLCGKLEAGGGQRFCWGCIAKVIQADKPPLPLTTKKVRK